MLPQHPAKAEPLRPWGQRRGRKGEPREGRSGWTASMHKYAWLSSHLLVGLTGEIVLIPHLLPFPKQREKLKPCRANRLWRLQGRIVVPLGWSWLNTISKDSLGTRISDTWISWNRLCPQISDISTGYKLSVLEQFFLCSGEGKINLCPYIEKHCFQHPELLTAHTFLTKIQPPNLNAHLAHTDAVIGFNGIHQEKKERKCAGWVVLFTSQRLDCPCTSGDRAKFRLDLKFCNSFCLDNRKNMPVFLNRHTYHISNGITTLDTEAFVQLTH